jgi:hypothetical protein
MCIVNQFPKKKSSLSSLPKEQATLLCPDNASIHNRKANKQSLKQVEEKMKNHRSRLLHSMHSRRFRFKERYKMRVDVMNTQVGGFLIHMHATSFVWQGFPKTLEQHVYRLTEGWEKRKWNKKQNQ